MGAATPETEHEGPVPIAIEGQFEMSTGDGLTFVAVVRYIGDRPVFASLHALRDLVAIGSIKWGAFEAGEVTMIRVDQEFRRRGVGRVLWKVATEMATLEGWVTPQHSSDRTVEGDAWAQAMGASPAKKLISLAELRSRDRYV